MTDLQRRPIMYDFTVPEIEAESPQDIAHRRSYLAGENYRLALEVSRLAQDLHHADPEVLKQALAKMSEIRMQVCLLHFLVSPYRVVQP